MTRKFPLLPLLTASLTILFLLVIQAHHFQSRPYRQDEAWVVHRALEDIARIGPVQHTLQIFSQVPPENFLQDIWVHLFGHLENIVRYFSTLTTALALAMFYRLAADLFDRRTAQLALILLGTLSVFVYYTHEARPYAALAFGTIGFQWALLRFIRRPNRAQAVLALGLAVVPFHQHPFMLYVYAAQVICIVVFVRWDRQLYRRGLQLFLALAALIALRATINFFDRSGVIDYYVRTPLDDWERLMAGLGELYHHFRFNPEALGLFLVFVGIVLPFDGGRRDARMRFDGYWAQGWLVLSLLLLIGLAVLVNHFSPSLTPRNLLIIAPYLALIAALTLRQMPWQAQLLAAVFFCLPFVTQFRAHNGNADYWGLAEFVEDVYQRDRDGLVVIAPQAWQWIPIKYYFDERTAMGLSDSDIFYITRESIDKDNLGPVVLDESQVAWGADEWHRLQIHFAGRERLWVIQANLYKHDEIEDFLDWLDEGYALSSAHSAEFPEQTERTQYSEGYYRAFEVLNYYHFPQDPDPNRARRFGDDIRLNHWQVSEATELAPCQTIALVTFWEADANIDPVLSMTAVVVDGSGNGITGVDGPPGDTPSYKWMPRKVYLDERQIVIPCDIAPGQYPLLLGLYDAYTVENLPVNWLDGSPTGSDLLYLTTLQVAG